MVDLVVDEQQAGTAGKSVPSGFKLTEVGVIPEDWDVKCILDVSSKVTDGTHDTPKPIKEGIPFLTALHIKDNNIDFNNCYFLPENIHNEIYRRCNPEHGDILMVNIGAGTATTAVVNVHYEFSLKNVALIKPNINSNGYYINYALSFIKDNIVEAIISGGAQPFLSLSQIQKIKIALPTIYEQNLIANSLFNIDALIKKINVLIIKKQAIKTATMQQLLTGKTRLPQFALRDDGSAKGYKKNELGEIPEDWIVSTFGAVMKIRHGKNQKNVECFDGEYPIYATGGQIGKAKAFLYNKPSVLIGRKGTIDKPRYTDQPFWTVDTLFYSEISESADAQFIYYRFCMIDWMQYNEASGVPSLNAGTIESIQTALPSIDEQIAIAAILSDMDKEIQALQQRLDKTRQLKQGMMQELLTGKTRLI
ncbi:TPA: restriction endonuclease subunit S [Klebsiella quasipneumoniae subsp. quasipneumoniae]|nr:restriction endonuclease subunit S [Klebsiella quasipneumoniae subsp. quasipneumoniae]